MPITQDRMLALLYAASDYQRAFQTLAASCASAYDASARGEDARELLQQLALLAQLGASAQSAATLAVEYERAKPSALARNARSKARARQRRQGSRTTPGPADDAEDRPYPWANLED